MMGGWALLALHLSAVSAASFKNGRPDRPPLIWKWLSNAFGVEEEVIERVDIVEDTAVNATYLEELADKGFNITGVYLSPDSVLNPVKWLELIHGALPAEASMALRTLSPETRNNPPHWGKFVIAGDPYETEGQGNYWAKALGTTSATLCALTELLKGLSGLNFFAPKDEVSDSADEVIDEVVQLKKLIKERTAGNTRHQLISMGLDAACNIMKLGEVADSFRNANCKHDDDCETACQTNCDDTTDADTKDECKCNYYFCNRHRGTCERGGGEGTCTSDTSCKEDCNTVCGSNCETKDHSECIKVKTAKCKEGTCDAACITDCDSDNKGDTFKGECKKECVIACKCDDYTCKLPTAGGISPVLRACARSSK